MHIGERGDYGYFGLVGEKGEASFSGVKGEMGKPGITGPHGYNGRPGLRGPKGEEGDAGFGKKLKINLSQTIVLIRVQLQCTKDPKVRRVKLVYPVDLDMKDSQVSKYIHRLILAQVNTYANHFCRLERRTWGCR